MNKQIKLKFYIILFLIITIFSCIFILKYNFNHKKSNVISTLKFEPYIFFQNLEEDTMNEYFKEKVIYLNKEENYLSVGKNIKELNNNYFDIKFIFSDNILTIYINKLNKDDISIEYVSQEYLEELNNFLLEIIKCNNTTKEIIQITKEEFLILRKNMECISENLELKNINTEVYTIDFGIEKNMLRIKIKNRGGT